MEGHAAWQTRIHPQGWCYYFNPGTLVVVDSTRDQTMERPESVGEGEVWYDAREKIWKKISHSDRSAVEIGAHPLPLIDQIDYWEYIMSHPSHSDVMRVADIHANGQEALRFLTLSSLEALLDDLQSTTPYEYKTSKSLRTVLCQLLEMLPIDTRDSESEVVETEMATPEAVESLPTKQTEMVTPEVVEPLPTEQTTRGSEVVEPLPTKQATRDSEVVEPLPTKQTTRDLEVVEPLLTKQTTRDSEVVEPPTEQTEMATPEVVEPLPTRQTTRDSEVVEPQTEIATPEVVESPSTNQIEMATQDSEVVEPPVEQTEKELVGPQTDIQKGALQAMLMMAIASILRQKYIFHNKIQHGKKDRDGFQNPPNRPTHKPFGLRQLSYLYLNIVFFGVPFRYTSYISEVDKGLVENKVWRQQINRMVSEWTNFNILSGLVISATAAFLAVLDFPAIPKTATLISMLFALGSIMSGLYFISIYESWVSNTLESAVRSYAATLTSSQTLNSILLGLPLILLIWSIISFAVGILAYAFKGDVRGGFYGTLSLAVVVLFCMVAAQLTFKHLWDNNTPVSIPGTSNLSIHVVQRDIPLSALSGVVRQVSL